MNSSLDLALPVDIPEAESESDISVTRRPDIVASTVSFRWGRDNYTRLRRLVDIGRVAFLLLFYLWLISSPGVMAVAP